jgi:hypothetical protein
MAHYSVLHFSVNYFVFCSILYRDVPILAMKGYGGAEA